MKVREDNLPDVWLLCCVRPVQKVGRVVHPCTPLGAQEFPELLPMIQRKFRSNGDVDAAQRLVFASRGIDRARELAAQHAGLAVQAVRSLATLIWQMHISTSPMRSLRCAPAWLRRRCAPPCLVVLALWPRTHMLSCLRELCAQVEAMPPAVTAHARQCRDALLAITERVLTRKK